MRVPVLCFALTLLLVSCDDDPFRPSDIKEVTWKLELIEPDRVAPIQIPNPDLYTLTLGNDGRVSVRADCNNCSASYTLDGSRLRIGALACTLIGCPSGSLGASYAVNLEGTSSITISDSHLVLRNEIATLRFRN